VLSTVVFDVVGTSSGSASETSIKLDINSITSKAMQYRQLHFTMWQELITISVLTILRTRLKSVSEIQYASENVHRKLAIIFRTSYRLHWSSFSAM